MDSDSCRREQNTKESTQEKNDGPKPQTTFGNCKFDDGNVFPAVRIRRAISYNNEINTFLLDYGFYFLLPFGTLLYAAFFIFS
jgi:hypothetical protein